MRHSSCHCLRVVGNSEGDMLHSSCSLGKKKAVYMCTLDSSLVNFKLLNCPHCHQSLTVMKGWSVCLFLSSLSVALEQLKVTARAMTFDLVVTHTP